MEQNKLFKSFVNDIIQVFPEYKGRLFKTYEYTLQETIPEDYSLKNDTLLSIFINNVVEHIEQIITEDHTLFLNDPILLQNVSFKIIWGSNISHKTKKSLWRYLQTFCLLHLSDDINDKKMNDVIQQVENNEKVSDKETVKQLKYIKKLNELLTTEDIENENENENQGLDGMESLLENTGIGQIAKNITEELDIENMLGENGGIEELLNGENMMNIFQTINSKIENELSNDPNSKDNLIKEASDICGNMQGNPLFSSIMGSMQSMFQGGGMPQPPPQDVKNIQMNKGPHSSNKTRQRLQKKLREKEKEKLKVEKLDSES